MNEVQSRLTRVLAAAVLLLLVSGPLLDHHIAERLPHHGHLALGGQLQEHQHAASRQHEHGAAAAPGTAQTMASGPLVSLVPNFGGTLGASIFVLGLALLPTAPLVLKPPPFHCLVPLPLKKLGSFTPSPELPPPRPLN